MKCDRDMCYQNLWNDVHCEDCPCYEEEQGEEMGDFKDLVHDFIAEQLK